MEWYRNKNLLITGAASGIGRLMALMSAEAGANIALVDINEKQLLSVEKEIKEKGAKAVSYPCDISKKNEVIKTSERIKKDFLHIDVLFNNAGVVTGKEFIDLSIDDFERTMGINFWGHIYFTYEFLPQMIEREEGNIVNIASSGGLLGMPLLSDYCASKFAEVGFSESLKVELHKRGYKKIKITCVCPYIIDTGMFAGFKPFLLNPYVKAEKAAEKILKSTAKGRFKVLIPYVSVKSMLILKLFPNDFFNWILKVFGAEKAMDSFKGR